eukprot:gene18570-18855_t
MPFIKALIQSLVEHIEVDRNLFRIVGDTSVFEQAVACRPTAVPIGAQPVR